MEASRRTATATPQPRTSPRSAAMAAERSWGDVPDNILVCVYGFLRCRADRVHMACVNMLWSAAVRGKRRPRPPVLPPLPALPPQLPWLIFPSTAAPTFYSPITRRRHPLGRLPHDVRRARCLGSGDGGWLVLALGSRHALHALYNLNSGQRIPLPAIFTTPAGIDVPLVARAATLSAPPSPNPYTVAAIVLVADRSAAAFWSEGTEFWFSTGALLDARPQDVIYHGGAFFFVTSHEGVVAFRPTYGWNNNVNLDRVDFDMQRRADYDDDAGVVEGMGLGAMRRYLVESRGHLLMVVRYVYNQSGRTEMIRVFEFHVMAAPAAPNAQRPRATWEHVGNGLDGRMLFLGRGCSRSFEVAHYNGAEGEFEESMVYFLDDGLISVPSADGRRLYSFADMGRYSMGGMATEHWPPGLYPTVSDSAPPTWWLH